MRMGKKKQPTYRVVAADSRKARNGRFIEIVGTYNPRREPSLIEIDNERALHWLRNGAQPSERVQKLLVISGAWAEFKGEDAPADEIRPAIVTTAASAQEPEQSEQSQAAEDQAEETEQPDQVEQSEAAEDQAGESEEAGDTEAAEQSEDQAEETEQPDQVEQSEAAEDQAGESEEAGDTEAAEQAEDQAEETEEKAEGGES